MTHSCPSLQEGDFFVRTHHVEYCDGGILDPDDILSDLVEDKDKVKTTPTLFFSQQVNSDVQKF